MRGTRERQAVRAKDLSLGGACVISAVPYAVGAAVCVHVPWLSPDGAATQHAEEIAARVVWVTRIEADYQLGLAFEPVTGSARRCLEEACELLARQAPEAPASPKRSFDLS